MDGSDESDIAEVNIPKKFQCIACSGVVLSAGHLCATSGRGMNRECVTKMMGEGDCAGCVDDFFDNLPNE